MDWKRRVKREYNRLYNLKRLSEDDKTKPAWNNNREFMEEWTEKHDKLRMSFNCEWKPNEVDAPHVDQMKKAKITFQDASNQEVPMRILPEVKRLPKMGSWKPTTQNIMMDVDIGDGVHRLIKNFDQGHSMDDNIFVDLVKALIPFQLSNETVASTKRKLLVNKDESEENRKSKQAKEGICDTEYSTPDQRPDRRVDTANNEAITSKKPFPAPIIFQSISACFPSKGNEDELREKYIKLTEHRRPECTPNIDGPKAESVSRDKSSLQSWFCRRCFKYDCVLHHLEKGQPKSNLQTRRFQELNPYTKPCGESCHTLMKRLKVKLETDKKETPSESSREMSSNDSNGNHESKHNHTGKDAAASLTAEISPLLLESKATLSVDGEWNATDQTMFRELRKVYLNNYCVIAKIMRTKTCEQVYCFGQNEHIDIPFVEHEDNKSPHKKHKNQLWSTQSRKMKSKKLQSEVFYHYSPCDHQGRCDDNCSCIQTINFCEKFCNCGSDCQYRFPGCRCKGQCDKEQCPCFLSLRECDPDLCNTCGASEVDLTKIICKNVSIQRGFNKRLLVAPSDVIGWGAFVEDSCQKDELIAEYCGEIISQDEANRRGEIYDKKNSNFLFNLNNDFVVDATKVGNKIRFANHSINPNCYAKVLMVNGDHRIGIFAKRLLQPREELFLDYRYGPDELKFVAIEREVQFV